jgi:hypothetical protein
VEIDGPIRRSPCCDKDQKKVRHDLIAAELIIPVFDTQNGEKVKNAVQFLHPPTSGCFYVM